MSEKEINDMIPYEKTMTAPPGFPGEGTIKELDWDIQWAMTIPRVAPKRRSFISRIVEEVRHMKEHEQKKLIKDTVKSIKRSPAVVPLVPLPRANLTMGLADKRMTSLLRTPPPLPPPPRAKLTMGLANKRLMALLEDEETNPALHGGKKRKHHTRKHKKSNRKSKHHKKSRKGGNKKSKQKTHKRSKHHKKRGHRSRRRR